MTSPLYILEILIFLMPSACLMFYVREYETQVEGKNNIKFAEFICQVFGISCRNSRFNYI